MRPFDCAQSHSLPSGIGVESIKRTIASPEPTGLGIKDFLEALNVEYKQNDIFPPNDITEDWLKLVDYDPENVVKLSPVKPRRTEASAII